LRSLAARWTWRADPSSSDGRSAAGIERGDFATAAVLDAGLPRRPVLPRESDEIAPADAIVHMRKRNLAPAEFAALRAEVLRPRVEMVDLLV
jgi:hypothetical protein